MKNIQFQRNRFEKVLSYYGKQGIAPEISVIRIDEKLVNGQGVYNFNLKKEILSAGESNLKRNDLFVVDSLGVFLTIKDTTKPGTEQILSFVQLENAAGIDGFTTNDINALYNGALHIATGTTVNVNAMPCSLFEKIPNRQPELIMGVKSDDSALLGTNGVKASFSLEDTVVDMAEELIFAGTQDHKVQVSFPTFASANYQTTAANCETYIIFVAVGYRVIGGTSEQYKNDPANPYASAI